MRVDAFLDFLSNVHMSVISAQMNRSDILLSQFSERVRVAVS